jgi:hypothetical protein
MLERLVYFSLRSAPFFLLSGLISTGLIFLARSLRIRKFQWPAKRIRRAIEDNMTQGTL